MSCMSKQVVATNRKAHFHYHILDTYEAGIVLTGAEIKSLRAGKISLAEGWVSIEEGQATLRQVHIQPYLQDTTSHGLGSVRPRKLLLHRRELKKIGEQVMEKGLSVVPLSVYIHGRWAKVKIGVARGKKLHDKRASEKKKAAERLVRASLKQAK